LLTLRFHLLKAKLKDRINDKRKTNKKTGDKIAFVLNYCPVNYIIVLNKIQ
jgi:ASC-1-like (ASCH) protein